VGPVTRLRHYTGLSSTLGRLTQLLREFRFDSIANILNLGPATDSVRLGGVWPANARDHAGAPR